MIAAADLDALLHRLRTAGLRVGVEESLRAAFLITQLESADAGDWLREVLRALLVKSSPQSESFDEVFTEWAQELAEREQPFAAGISLRSDHSPDPGNQHSDRIQPPHKPSLKHLLNRHRFRIALFLLLLVGTGLLGRRLREQPGANDPNPAAPDMRPATPTPVLQPIQTPKLRVLEPRILVEPSPLPKQFYQGGTALLSGLLLGGILYFGLRRRRYLPVALAPPTRPGPRQIRPILPHPTDGVRLRLLDLRSQEALVWGIGRFVSEQPTRRLNVEATVGATAARAGIPSLRFLNARHQREVWLWSDESASGGDRDYGPLLRLLCRELVTSLRQGGLPVAEALYWGLPDRLTRLLDTGHPDSEFAPSEVEERRDAALVVLMTDGRILADALHSERYRDEANSLLRQLAHFPQLAFCDVTRGKFGLARLIQRFGLTVLVPEQVAKFLGGVPLDPPPVQPPHLVGDLRLWAAACALSPYPLDEETMFWVRDQLDLTAEAAAIVRLKELAQPVGEQWWFSGFQRAQLLGWLRHISLPKECPPHELTHRLLPTWLGRILAGWHRYLCDADQAHADQDPTVPWRDTPAQQHLRVQRSLLDLWDQPEAAVVALYSLYQGVMKDEIAQRLAHLGSIELSGHSELTILPWRELELPNLTQACLRAMGFGGNRPLATVQARSPGRLYVAWTGCLGLLVAGAITVTQGVWLLQNPKGEPLVRQEHEPNDARIELTKQSSSVYQLTASSAQTAATMRVTAGANILVSWEAAEREPPGGGNDERRDLAVAQSVPPDLSEIDSVLQSPDLAKRKEWPDLANLTKLGAPKSPMAKGEIANPEVVSGIRSPQVVSSTEARTEAKSTGVELDTAWSCPYQEWTDPKSSVVFVKVCGGVFQMGSENVPDAYDDEKPSYPVKLSEYWIGKYEISNREYRKLEPDHKGQFNGDDLPVESVGWNKARAYCRSIGGDLPTEAEWEYAARGPEGRQYPWGNTPLPDIEHAVFNQGFNKGPAVTRTKPKGQGPFGTLNQAGNVREWVTDCYQKDQYAKRKAQSERSPLTVPIINPVEDRSGCEWRVLRGGSFVAEPRILRSANRDRNRPEDQAWYIGFRCVRGSHRQP